MSKPTRPRPKKQRPKIDDPSHWPRTSYVHLTNHAMERAAERLPVGVGSIQDRISWIKRAVRRASNDRALSPHPPAWTQYRSTNGAGDGFAWVSTAVHNTPVAILVSRQGTKRNKPGLIVITVMTAGTVNWDEVVEMTS